MYVKFMFTLAVGLAGVAMVLKTLLETILRAPEAMQLTLTFHGASSTARDLEVRLTAPLDALY